MESNSSPYFSSPNSYNNGSFSSPNLSSPWQHQRQAVSPQQPYRGSGPPSMSRTGSRQSISGTGSQQSQFYSNSSVPQTSFLSPNWNPGSSRSPFAEVYDTMSRFANERDAPFSPFIAPDAANVRSLARYSEPNNVFLPGTDVGGYRNKATSDVVSNADSGYRSKTVDTQSVMSADYNKPRSEIDLHLNRINLSEGAARSRNFTGTVPSFPPQSTTSRKSGISKACKECGKTFGCTSDYKKHMAKHDKPYKCDVADCTRTAGFCTVNDLDRHKKSVHSIKSRPSKDYKCASSNCKHPEKVWPRLDNFKQHLNRMHPNEDPNELLKRSEVHTNSPQQSPSNLPSVMPIETALAGIGETKDYQLSSNPQDPVIPDQLHWDFEFNSSNENYDITSAIPISRQGALPLEVQPKEFSDAYDPDLMPGGGTVPEQNVSNLSHAESTQPQESSGLEALAHVAVAHGSTGPSRSLTGASADTDFSSGLSASLEGRGAHINMSSSINRLDGTSGNTNEASSQNIMDKVLQLLLDKPKADSSPNCTLGAEDAASFKDAVQKRLEEMFPKNQAGKKATRSAPSTKGPIGKQCAKCEKWIPRDCDMRKHMKRHTRPYGCTYPNCNKRFGSKNDWKRHENSQHFQLEMWRCQIPSHDGKQAPCAEIFWNRDLFESHLRENHKIADDGTKDEYKKKSRIGRNGQSQFWCGFCRNIIPLKQRGVAAWDERFSHIDDQHFKKGEDIKDWLCCVANKTKREVAKMMDKKRFDDDILGDTGSDAEGTAQRDPHPDSYRSSEGHGNAQEQLLGKRRRRSSDAVQDGRHDILLYCCQCNSGPFLAATSSGCGTMNPSCNHTFCANCSRKMEKSFD